LFIKFAGMLLILDIASKVFLSFRNIASRNASAVSIGPGAEDFDIKITIKTHITNSIKTGINKAIEIF
jgi:hypothetical protein